MGGSLQPMFARRFFSQYINGFALVFLLSLPVQAAENQSTLKAKDRPREKIGNPTGPFFVPPAQDLDPRFQGLIRLESQQYLTDLPEASHLTQTQLLSARLNGRDQFRDENFQPTPIGYGVDFTTGTYFSWRQSHLYVNEIFTDYKWQESLELTFGRRKYEWSELETRWQLGIWQPRYTLDALRPEDQGLTGVFVHQKQDRQEFLVMVTPLYIPTMGPEVREEDGTLVSDTRWHRLPKNKWNFNNQETPIIYKMSQPDIDKLVFRMGSAARYRWGSAKDGPRLTLAATSKPVNDLILRRQNFQVISRTHVSISPDVTRHLLYSGDIGYTRGPVNASLSFLEDQPEEIRPDRDWVIQKLDPIHAYSANFDFDLQSWAQRPLQIQTSYLRVFSGGIKDIEPDGTISEMTLFESRLKFSNALMLNLNGELARPYGKRLMSKFGYIYDYEQKGTIWSLEFQLFPANRWAVVLGADLLGVEEESDQDRRFINQFRANDRYYGGMSYVF